MPSKYKRRLEKLEQAEGGHVIWYYFYSAPDMSTEESLRRLGYAPRPQDHVFNMMLLPPGSEPREMWLGETLSASKTETAETKA